MPEVQKGNYTVIQFPLYTCAIQSDNGYFELVETCSCDLKLPIKVVNLGIKIFIVYF